jgi:hypothetical protein
MAQSAATPSKEGGTAGTEQNEHQRRRRWWRRRRLFGLFEENVHGIWDVVRREEDHKTTFEEFDTVLCSCA